MATRSWGFVMQALSPSDNCVLAKKDRKNKSILGKLSKADIREFPRQESTKPAAFQVESQSRVCWVLSWQNLIWVLILSLSSHGTMNKVSKMLNQWNLCMEKNIWVNISKQWFCQTRETHTIAIVHIQDRGCTWNISDHQDSRSV